MIKPSRRKDKTGTVGKPKAAGKAVAGGRPRSSLQRSFDLLWLAQELATATSVDELLVAYNRRVVGARAGLLIAQGMDPEQAEQQAQRQAISRQQLERDIAAVQKAAEEHATAHARDGWLALAVEATEANRQTLHAIRARALRAYDRAPEGEQNAHLLAIAAATVPAEQKLLAELLGFHGLRQLQQLPVVVGNIEQLSASGQDVNLLLDVVRRDPGKGALAVEVLGRLMVAARRKATAEQGGGKPSLRPERGGAVGVRWNLERIGGEAEGSN